MERTVGNLKLEIAAQDSKYTTICVTGLTVAEMNYVLENGKEPLSKVMEQNGASDVYERWENEFGIYSIRHVGGHLFVMIGRL